MKTDLKERYIYAVVRHLPTKAQADVEKELDSLITEMLDERRGNSNAPSEQYLRDVLTELGTPEELALKYCGDERTALISGTYFLMYKRVLTIVLPIVAAVVIGSNIIMFISNTEMLNIIVLPFINITTTGNPLLNMFPSAFGTMVQAFTVITIIFAILDYYKVKLQDKDMLASLPEKPDTKKRIGVGEPIFSIVMSVVFVILLLVYPQIISGRFDGVWIPVFDIAVLRSLWLPIILWAVVSIVTEIVSLIEGRYTMRLAAVTVVTNIIVAICAIYIFGGNYVVNPEFISAIESVFSYVNTEWLARPFVNTNFVILGITLIALVVETIVVLVKTFLSRRG